MRSIMFLANEIENTFFYESELHCSSMTLLPNISKTNLLIVFVGTIKFTLTALSFPIPNNYFYSIFSVCNVIRIIYQKLLNKCSDSIANSTKSMFGLAKFQ